MSLFGQDTEFGNILQQAVKIKSAQMGQKRKTYETWPFFVQHTIYHGEKDEIKAWRQLPFDEKIVISEKIKEEGNELFAKNNFTDAIDKYERAASLVYYCYSTDPGWRKNQRGIDDDVIILVDDKGSSPQEAEMQKKLRVSCCLNIAACKQKQGEHKEAIIACDTALELDTFNVKALYRRAESRIKPAGSTAYDRDLAIQDLLKAHRADPQNQPVERLLTQLRAERRLQKEKDQETFTGMFDRGTIYKQGSNEGAAGGEEEDTLERRAADAELLRDMYMKNGKVEEAKELNEKIQVAKKAMKDRDKARVDWSNPSKNMIEDAKTFGLDLTDPVVLQALQRLESEVKEKGESILQDDPPLFDAENLEEALKGPPVPWMRYVVLFTVIFAIFRVLDQGLPRIAVQGLLSSISVVAPSFGQEEQEERDSVGGARAILNLLFGTSDRSELEEIEL